MSLMGVNLVKMGHFGEKGQNWVILGPKLPHMSNLGKVIKYIFSQKVYKNYSSQVYGQKFGKKSH